MREDFRLIFKGRGKSDSTEQLTWHMAVSSSAPLWTGTALNDYPDFPGIGQVFVIERPTIEKATIDTVSGVTRHTPASADAAAVLAFNRGHWTVENGCHYILD